MSWLKTEWAALKISCETIKRDPKKYLSVVVKSYLMGILTFTEKSLVTKDTIDEYNDYASIRNDYKKEEIMPILDPGKFWKILIPRIRPNQWVRIAYAYGSAVADIVDGHKKLPVGFTSIEELLDYLLYSLSEEELDLQKEKIAIVQLQKAVCAWFLKKWVDIKPYLIDALLWMKTEYQRRLWKQILSNEELVTLHNQSFRGAHQVYLVALGPQYQASDIAELPQILWFIYWLKDLKQDLDDNMCNIPKEVCDEIPYALWEPIEKLLDSDFFWWWVQSTIEEQKKNCAILENKISSMDKWVQMICHALLPEIYKFFDRYTKEAYTKHVRWPWTKKK